MSIREVFSSKVLNVPTVITLLCLNSIQHVLTSGDLYWSVVKSARVASDVTNIDLMSRGMVTRVSEPIVEGRSCLHPLSQTKGGTYSVKLVDPFTECLEPFFCEFCQLLTRFHFGNQWV